MKSARRIKSFGIARDALPRVFDALTVDNTDIMLEVEADTGFADAFGAAFEAAGGQVLASEAHEDGKADYRYPHCEAAPK